MQKSKFQRQNVIAIGYTWYLRKPTDTTNILSNHFFPQIKEKTIILNQFWA
jgi:hypothetical protein